jgi:dihydrolipoamide dehydrogenase
MSSLSPHIVILGAGPGGYPAAFLASEMGMKVTLVDLESQPGGVCLHYGCIPSKALLHAAHSLHVAHEAASFGIHFPSPEINLDKLRGWKDTVISRLTRGLSQIAKARDVTFVQGRGRFLDDQTLRVVASDELTDIKFDYAVVATGSRPVLPENLRLDSDYIWDSTEALSIPEIPDSLLVVGGGYVGLEMSGVYGALGSRITIVEAANALLPGVDSDLVDVMALQLEDYVENIWLNTTVSKLVETTDGIIATLSGPDADLVEIPFDRVLMSVGREPNVENLGLQELEIELTDLGFIQTDKQKRTSVSNIFAVGDVTGGVMLAHKASHEARVAIEAIAGLPSEWEPPVIPAVVFTEPEIAWTGITETDARRLGLDVEISKFPWSSSGRAITSNLSGGLTKIISESGTERVVGAGIVGRGASELIGEATLAIEMAARLQDLKLTVHPHPTLSETLMEASEIFFGTSPHHIGRR